MLGDHAWPMTPVGVDLDVPAPRERAPGHPAHTLDGSAGTGDDPRVLRVERDAKLRHSLRLHRDAAVTQPQTQQIDVFRRKAAEVVLDAAGPVGPVRRTGPPPSEPVADSRTWDAELPGDDRRAKATVGERERRLYRASLIHLRLDAAERSRTSTPVWARPPEDRVSTIPPQPRGGTKVAGRLAQSRDLGCERMFVS